MAKTKKTHGEVVGKIMTREAREHVGYLYEWNTGERQHAWFDEPVTDFVFEELETSNAKRLEKV
ncbi:hypothetical protein RM543_18345 [Roseicyclus sp. F158]|uniref:Uncharacterized protein n=1 Tax=Tropicimonas omnivorans TaxID=3075590 RepID=A0ABU3DLN6_9RHOB|nr:hypothetical protein [Roseicyclus sp. F158]MDT0684626.1 hypothetical protein [Roseicyclus sp. F158]